MVFGRRFAGFAAVCAAAALATACYAPAAFADTQQTTTPDQTTTSNATTTTATPAAQDQTAPVEKVDLSSVKPAVTYVVDAKKGKWLKARKNGKTTGVAQWDSELQRIRVKAVGPYEGGVKYRVRTVDEGWSAWTTDNKAAGVNGEPIEAVQMKLTGELAKHYHIYYRTYNAEVKWLDWAKDGQKAGTGKTGYPVGAIKVKLVKNRKSAPGKTKKPYTTKKVKKDGTQWTMNQKAQSQSSKTDWLIMVNRDNCWVGVFKGEKGNWKMKKFFRCSCGRKGHETPTGTFKIGMRFTPLNGKYTEYWAIHVTGYIHFHSILYWKGTHDVAVPTLGKHISMGCIRCPTEMAHWMYKKLPDDTTCTIYG